MQKVIVRKLNLKSKDNNCEKFENMIMKKQKTSIWERLRMAYKALTQDYYVFFGIDKDAIKWNDDGTYKGLDKKKMSMFSYISDNEKMKAYGKETNLHNFLWHFIEQFAKEVQNVKF